MASSPQDQLNARVSRGFRNANRFAGAFALQVVLRRTWRLVSRDNGLVIQGQFEPTQVEHDVRARWARTDTIGRQHPILMFEGGDLEVIRFTAKVWSHSSFDVGASDSLIEKVKGAVKIDRALGRPHVWELTMGTWSANVIVVGAGIRYDSMRSESGRFRGANFEIECWRYEEYNNDLVDTGAESQVTPLKRDDSMERIAYRTYKDPDAGEALRRRNTLLASRVSTGEQLHLPPLASLLRGFVLTPTNPTYEDDTQADAARRAHYAKRSGAEPSYVLPASWDGL